MDHDDSLVSECLKIAAAVVHLSDPTYRYVAEDSALTALVEALESHDPAGGRCLTAWVWYKCHHAVLDCILAEKRHREILESIHRESSGPHMISGNPSPYYAAMVADEAEFLLSCLYPRHRRVLSLWALGHTQVEISRILGVAQGHVSSTIQASLERIAEFNRRRKHIA